MEEWRKIEGFDHYEVSNLGTVRSIDRTLPSSVARSGTRFYPGVVFKPFRDKNGYPCVGLRDNDRVRRHLHVHRLVAAAFIPRPEGCNIVNHLDGNTGNPRVENLEWTTVSGNTKHAFDNGFAKPSPRSLPPEKEAEVRELLKGGMKMRDAAALFGVSKSLVHLIAHRQ